MRKFGQFACRMFDDPDVAALSPGAQRTYIMLSLREDISAAGVLPLTRRRWALTVPAEWRDQCDDWLTELVDAQFIVIDEDTDELLVRSFIRDDKGYGNPKRRPLIGEATAAVASQAIRSVILGELRRLNVQFAGITDVVAGQGVSDTGADRVSDRVSAPGPIGDPIGETKKPAVATVVGVVSSAVTTSNRKPETGNRKPAAKPPSDDEFDAFWRAYPQAGRRDKIRARAAFLKAVKLVPADVLVDAAQRYADDPNRADEFTKLPSTWLNAGAWENGPLPPRNGRASPSDQARATLELGRRLAAAPDYPPLELMTS